MTRIIRDLNVAAEEIIKGNVVGLPTETVYGLGANALDGNAVLKIFETKDRPFFNPLIVHVSGIEDFVKYGEDIPEKLYDLAGLYSPGPITYIVKKKILIPDIVTAGLNSVALRIPAHQMFREVLQRSDVPIAAPSANRSGKISPTSAEDVLKELEGKIDYILDGGKCGIGIESTVINFADGDPEILRTGSISKTEIENIIGKTSDKRNGKVISPGQSKSHYAPVTPLYIVNEFTDADEIKDKKTGVLDFSGYSDLEEIAVNLYSDIRKLDQMNFDIIVCRKVDQQGIGIAINDRLERASVGEIKFIDQKLKVILK
ncbi:MAG: L-threonylcarbamoyladenylate synthase [Bacteroidota bacterium]|nr:L-threonylcarbamoyladenylate synthase [Bacteroidota bacterium]